MMADLTARNDPTYLDPLPGAKYIELHMKHILVELDDRCARDLERVAPAKKRMRAEFVRLAIRRAIDLALDRTTARAYFAQPLAAELAAPDLVGWDEHNDLARPARVHKRMRARTRGTKNAA